MKTDCIVPYRCRSCGENCLHDKRVVIQLGSNDLLKRQVLPQFPFPRGKTSINVKWDKALNIILQKMRYSNVNEVVFLDIPDFSFIDMSEQERYFSKLFKKFSIFFQDFLLFLILSDIREKIRESMKTRMEKMLDQYSNKFKQNPLKCKMIHFKNEKFLDENIHLEKSAQLRRLAIARKKYKILKYNMTKYVT